MDFFIRAQRQGFTLVAAPESVVCRYWERERLTLPGVMRRAFRLGNAEAHIDRLHMSAQDHRRRRRKVRKKMLRQAISLPRRLLTPRRLLPSWLAPRRLAVQLHNLSRVAGRLYGRGGGKFRYYG